MEIEPNLAQQQENQTLLKTLKQDRNAIIDAIQEQKNKSNNNQIVHLTLINLAISFLFGILILQGLTVDIFYQDLNSAYTVIKGLQRQVTQQVITKITQKQESDDCQSSLGYFPGTNKGCICPNMQTSNQQCLNPCQIVDTTGSQKIYILDGRQYCIQYEDSNGQNGLNDLIEVNNNEENAVQFIDKKILFKRKENAKNGEFYKIIIAPDKPCFNTALGALKQSQLTYPFSTIQYIGCDRYSSWKDDALQIAETTHGKIMSENNIFTNNLPFYHKYHDDNDPLKIFILRKIFINQGEECQQAIRYKFSQCYVSCLFIQVFELVVCYFSIILFFIGSIFFIAIKLSKLFKKDSSQVYVNKKLKYKVRLNEILEKSIVILGILIAIVVILSQGVFQYGLNNNDGLKKTSQYTQQLLNKTCFSNQGILKAIKVVQNAVTNCTSDIYVYAVIWFVIEILYLIVGYIVLKQITAKKQMQ